MLHTGVGQEATQAALAAHLKATDCFFPDHRCHGINALAEEKYAGAGERIMAELFGRASGVCSGKGGSLHSANPQVGNFGDNAVEGSFMVTVLGVALAWKMRKEPKVACCIIGDGTVGRGEFHESLNLAAIWQLPVLYACVNNGYAISTPVGKAHASADIVDLARGYGFPCIQVDGNDIEAAYAEVAKAVDYIRGGKGPYFLEFKTWRWQGIFSGEFRPADEVRYWKEERDPIKLARAQIQKRTALTDADLDRIEAETKAEIETWIDFAKQSPMPDPAKATADVYVGWNTVQDVPAMAHTPAGTAAVAQPAPQSRVRTYVQALNEALDLALARDPNVFLLGEDIGVMGGDFGVTRGLWAKFGDERVRDTPLSEAAIVGASVGAAMVGMRPVAEIMFADFLGECYDQLVNNAAKLHYMFDGQFKASIVVRTACGGGFGGGPHHSQSVEGWFLNVPGLAIVAPATPADAKGLLLASIENDNPILFLEHKALYRIKGDVPEGYYTTPLRQALVVREGSDVTIVAAMKMVYEALAAADELAGEGISAEVLDLRTLRPYDAATVLASVRKTGRAVVAVEAPKLGGLAAELSATIAEECFHDLKAPVVRVGGLDTPIPFSLVLEKYILPGKDEIAAAARRAVQK